MNGNSTAIFTNNCFQTIDYLIFKYNDELEVTAPDGQIKNNKRNTLDKLEKLNLVKTSYLIISYNISKVCED